MIRSSIVAVALVCSVASAAEQPAKQADPRGAIAKKFKISADEVRSSPVKGIFEVPMGADTLYVSADGRYVFSGDLYDADSKANLTEVNRAKNRTKLLAKLDEKDMIIFGPAAAQHTITVFTDVDCGYCRKLHNQVEQLNELGVRVRYVAYPRSGPGSEDWRKMESVWCASDRKAAITQAKQGQPVKSPACATPLAKQYQLGEDLGVRGTPAIFTRDGDYIGGYMPPAELRQHLDQLHAAAVSARNP